MVVKMASAISGILGAKATKKAGKKAKKLSRQQAEAERFELAESLRRLDVSQGQQAGARAVGAGATGLSTQSGSIKNFLEEQRSQAEQERDFAETQGQRRIQLTLQGGRNAASLANDRARNLLIETGIKAGQEVATAFATGGASAGAGTSSPAANWWTR
jgi:hypothetical protein